MLVLILLAIQAATGSSYTSDKDIGSGSGEITHDILHKQNHPTIGEMGSGSGETASGSGETGSGSGEPGSGSGEPRSGSGVFPPPPPSPLPQDQEYQTVLVLSASGLLFVTSAVVVAYTLVPVLSPSYGLIAV